MFMTRALQLFLEAWQNIKGGNLFDESTNNTFDYILKNLWSSPYKNTIKTDIMKNLPSVFIHGKDVETPPPVFYILIGLKDNDIINELQSLILIEFIKSNASESATFQLLNFIETFHDKQIPIVNFVSSAIKRITPRMNREMVEALAYMTTIHHPELMRHWLKRFLSLSSQDDTILKNYVNMSGRKAFLELMQIATPEQMNRIFKQFKK